MYSAAYDCYSSSSQLIVLFYNTLMGLLFTILYLLRRLCHNHYLTVVVFQIYKSLIYLYFKNVDVLALNKGLTSEIKVGAVPSSM